MGLRLIDTAADFSAIAIGHAGLFTSLTDGLLSLFETRRSAAKTRQNSAPASDAPAAVSGSPTFLDAAVVLTAVGNLVFPSGLVNSGEQSFALILQMKNGGANTDLPVASLTAAPTTDGAAYLIHWNRRVQFVTTLFDSLDDGAAYLESDGCFLDFTADKDGTSQLFVVTLSDDDRECVLHHPASGASATLTLTSGQHLYFQQGVAGRNWQARAGAGSSNQQMSLFAHWDQVLTDEEIETFYGEMKGQFERLGLTI